MRRGRAEWEALYRRGGEEGGKGGIGSVKKKEREREKWHLELCDEEEEEE